MTRILIFKSERQSVAGGGWQIVLTRSCMKKLGIALLAINIHRGKQIKVKPDWNGRKRAAKHLQAALRSGGQGQVFCRRGGSGRRGAGVQSPGVWVRRRRVAEQPVSLQFLLLHASVLKPNFHLRLAQLQGAGHLHPPGPRQVLVEVELLLQLGQLLGAEAGPRGPVHRGMAIRTDAAAAAAAAAASSLHSSTEAWANSTEPTGHGHPGWEERSRKQSSGRSMRSNTKAAQNPSE